jgi:hypothetical protein
LVPAADREKKGPPPMTDFYALLQELKRAAFEIVSVVSFLSFLGLFVYHQVYLKWRRELGRTRARRRTVS